jgi:hypothetical protein
VHPDFKCAYAAGKYVLVAAPGKLPVDRAGVVVLCSRHHQNAAYTSQGLTHNTPTASKARKAAAAEQQQQPPPPLPAAAESGPRTGAHGQAGTSTRSAKVRAQDPIMQALSKRALDLAAEVAEARAATDASQVRVYVRAGCGLGFGRLHAKWVCSIAGTLTCIPGANRTSRSIARCIARGAHRDGLRVQGEENDSTEEIHDRAVGLPGAHIHGRCAV